MDLLDLIDALSVPAAYPYPVGTVEVRQTHISVVFLAGPYVYKVKKPVNPGFLDFTTLEKRRHFCAEEVRLNRRLAPEVYVGVVPVAQTDAGLRLEAAGPVVEWAVKMQRLPDAATLHAQIGRGEVGRERIEALAQRIAAFHCAAETNERIAAFGTFANVARTVQEIFAEAGPQVGITVSPRVFDQLRALVNAALDRLRGLINARAAHGMPRLPRRPAPGPYLRLPRSPAARRPGRHRLHRVQRASPLHRPGGRHGVRGDGPRLPWPARPSRQLHRGVLAGGRRCGGRGARAALRGVSRMVRGMVEGLELAEPEVPSAERTTALSRARAHWLLALAELAEPSGKPCLLLVAGLPGSGKSRLAAGLAERAGFTVVRTDVVRKELAGAEPRDSRYSQAWNDRTYAECLRRAEQLVREGRRVIVDATFREEAKRRLFLDAAAAWGVPAGLLLCEAAAETVRQRLADRHGDASDADWSVHRQLAATWEPLAARTVQQAHAITTAGTPEQTLALALAALRQLGLHSDDARQ